MADSFPTTPQASTATRAGAIVMGVAALAIATWGTIASSKWVGKPFPGFVILDNRVIASIGLPHWSGRPEDRQSEVVAVDGVPVASAAAIYRAVREHPPGALVRYGLHRAGVDHEVEIATQRFTPRDWILLFGPFLLSGIVFLGCGLVTWILRPRSPLSRALLAWGSAVALWLLTVLELYEPGALFRLHIIGESFAPAACLQLGLLLPQTDRWSRWRFASYPVALALLIAYEVFLYQPAVYSYLLLANMLHLGVVGVIFVGRLVTGYVLHRSPLARQRVRVITLGTLFGFGPTVVILLGSAIAGGGVPMNLANITPALFALSLAYAVVKTDLFEIDAMVKRGAYYLLLTAAVGAAYLAAVSVFSFVVPVALVRSGTFPIVFTLVVLVFLNPLRTRLQTIVDRVFFRTAYDASHVLARIGALLAASLQRERIAEVVRRSVLEAIPNACTRLLARADGELYEIGGSAQAPGVLARHLAAGRVLTTFDPPELYVDSPTHHAVREALVGLEAEIAVPLLLRGELVGVLTAGPKHSRLFYTAGDAEFLRALAAQAAIALENARTYEEVAELNSRLEQRVRERTAQLENTHGRLEGAYGDLKRAQVQLVQSEKLASLGRVVAGVAHEINNPVSFITTSVEPLRRRLSRAQEKASPAVGALLTQADEIVGVMARGAERTAAIVRDLRTFSRLGEAERKAVDLVEGLEMSTRLLEARWHDRIVIHRSLAPLAPVECDPGQVNQVFVNLIANACDAIPGEGNLWLATEPGDGMVTITVRDDGVGMSPEVLARIFDPFFTTKDVGRGTGLGLAIAHSIVNAHGGTIAVESAPGTGTTFRVTLPLVAPPPQRAAAGA